ncbi:molybdopterin molybdotransferase MoeA [Defluviimonas sp. WL0024]|uniref:Molybdopterin molybdenumtransferase n=1 Tax=Albidovulum salinarum TaxID=2984153 RepID=A0ABT2WZ15_9RHOB|nr:gephyrin-like molybdotransferase Glp [Defluviimonas sp. WL0024]MCU9846665.1 molybdopterin molybdotransferase MoeA [Defluviimonas sp. WL0024]
MISVDEALSRLFALSAPLGSETVPLRHGAGRVLAEPVVAGLDQPPFAASAMDGYAIRETDHRPGVRLNVIGEAAAGLGFSGTLSHGEAVRIFTGAPVPEGADRVVLQEDVSREGDRITLTGPLEHGANIRAAGQDFHAGDRIEVPRRLSATDLALIAAMNVAELRVARRPIVAIMATGNELVMPGEAPGPDQIIASNGYALAAMAEAEGAEVRMLPIARDSESSLRHTLALAEGADLIVTIGGASVGDHDLVGKVTADLGMERSFYKIAMRPGKPLMAGRLAGSTLLGLPGNPVSSVVCGHVFMLPMLRAMQGLPAAPAPVRRGVLAAPVEANGPRAHYMRARVEQRDGACLIHPFEQQDSALLTVLAEADALLIRPVGDGPQPAGTAAEFIPI